MSIRLLRNPTAFHELQDDLESFFYIVLYLALRYLPHNKVPELPVIMAKVFEEHSTMPTAVVGGMGKYSLFNDGGHLGEDLEFTDNEPITSWIDVTLKLVRDWYDYLGQSKKYVVPGTPSMELKDRPFRDHNALDRTFQIALAKKWPKNDKAADHLPPNGRNAHSKRKREGADGELGKTKKSKSSTSQIAPSLQRSDHRPLRRSSRLGPKHNGTK